MLRPRFGDFLGEIRLEGARYAYPLGLSLAERWTAPRLALAGDAAHGIHPLAGQGLNLGLRDVAALAEVLVGGAPARRRTSARADVLGGYAALAAVRHRGARGGDGRAEPAVLERQSRCCASGATSGSAIVNRLPPLRRALIAEAAGLSGDLPPLLRGRRL